MVRSETLIPGFIIAGLGSGMVNPPLASTAIGVVPPHQAGMASGTNATFRQIGIATGIAALGSIFVSAMQSHLASTLPPSLAGSAGTIAAAARQGSVGHVLASVPAADRGPQRSRYGPASPPASTTCCTSRRPWRWWAGSARCC